MSGTVAEDSKDVLDKIKAEGTFDQMRVQVTEAVKRTVRCTKACLQTAEPVSQIAIVQDAGYSDVSGSATSGQ